MRARLNPFRALRRRARAVLGPVLPVLVVGWTGAAGPCVGMAAAPGDSAPERTMHAERAPERAHAAPAERHQHDGSASDSAPAAAASHARHSAPHTAEAADLAPDAAASASETADSAPAAAASAHARHAAPRTAEAAHEAADSAHATEPAPTPTHAHGACPHCPGSAAGAPSDSHARCGALDNVSDAKREPHVVKLDLKTTLPSMAVYDFVSEAESAAARRPDLYRRVFPPSVPLNLRHCILIV